MIQITGTMQTREGSREVKVSGKDEESALAAFYEEILIEGGVEEFAVTGSRIRGIGGARAARKLNG